MLTKIKIRNFKKFDYAEIDLTASVVFIGPNNSGKTTALQALALWDAGCKQWMIKRTGGKKEGDTAKAITMGRKDLVYVPVPSSTALWKGLKVREGYREDDKTKTKNIHIEIIVDGIDKHGKTWSCGLEFEYANEEYFYCRPLRLDDSPKPARMLVPAEALEEIKIALLPPMSGLAREEALLQPGRVEVLLGNGQSGEVLRNLCYAVFEHNDGSWEKLVAHMHRLFGIKLNQPVFVSQSGSVEVDFTSEDKTILPLTSAGLGMLQTLHLLVYLYSKPNAVFMLDEPDAHLEILRQRQTYQLLTEICQQNKSQVICASHSEVVLNEAVSRDTVVAFVGKPHIVSGNQGSQVLKALKDIGFEHYIQAEQTGWVIYVEGSTDLAILQSWAAKLNHPSENALSKPFVHYLNTNLPSTARAHFNAVKEANPKLIGIAVFDKLELPPQGEQNGLIDFQWQKREIENYFSNQVVLIAFAKGEIDTQATFDLIDTAESYVREEAMKVAISEVEQAFSILGKYLWSDSLKTSEEVLPAILERYFEKTKDARTPRAKSQYYQLVDYQPVENIHADVLALLDSINNISVEATPHG